MVKHRIITISGKIATGTSTLAKNLAETLGWKHVNAGEIQRHYDRKHNLNENQIGAIQRSDAHEREIDKVIAKKLLEEDKDVIYEAWLAGFMAKEIPDVFKILLICSDDAVRVDRVANRDNVTIDEVKIWIKQREEENVKKWQKLYGNHDFWDPKYYDLVIDTFSSGPLETLGEVLDKIGFKGKIPR